MPRPKKKIHQAVSRWAIRKLKQSSNNEDSSLSFQSTAGATLDPTAEESTTEQIENPVTTVTTSNLNCTYLKCIRGTTHQGNINIFLNPGLQCSYMALISLIKIDIKDPRTWGTADIDAILFNGDRLFHKHFLGNTNAVRMLSAFELPQRIQVFGIEYAVIMGKEFVGVIYAGPVDQDSSVCGIAIKLCTAIENLFAKCKFGLFFCSNQVVAVAFREGIYYIFDSHSRDAIGLKTCDGKAILRMFPNQNKLVKHLHALFMSSVQAGTEQFELVPCSLQRSSYNTDALSTHRSIMMYIKDQKNRNDTFQSLKKDDQIEFNKRSYMKKYMQKKRLQLNFTKAENIKAVQRMRNRRSNEICRVKECKKNAKRMRNKRKEDENMQKEKVRNEARIKRTRTNLEYKHSEGIKNRERINKLRSTEDFKRREGGKNAMRMTKLRGGEKYKQSESIKNVQRIHKLRSSTDFRNKEAVENAERMTKVRAKEEYKQSESIKNVQRIHKLRSSRDFRNKEAVENAERMTKVRAREEYKQSESIKNVQRIQNLRSSWEFRNKEAVENADQMQKRRANKGYKDRECTKNTERIQKLRSSEDFKVKERIRNVKRVQKLRDDPQYLRLEASRDKLRKKNKRENFYFRECERVKKQQERTNKRKREGSCLASNKRRKGEIPQEKQNSKINILCIQNQSIGFQQSVLAFQDSLEESATYICSCCDQLLFKESVKQVSSIGKRNEKIFKDCLTGKLSVKNKEWVCHTCVYNIKRNRVPKLSVRNGMKFPEKPPELELSNLEERLIALRIPFMQIRCLASGSQFQIRGSVVNVPAHIEPTIRALPRNIDETGLIPVRLKRMLQMKHAYITENVRPAAVLSALKKLVETSALYKDAEVNINFERNMDSDFLENHEDYKSDSSDNFSEVDESESNPVATLLDEPESQKATVLSVAPGEGQKPLSLYNDPDAEYLAFPSLFCGQKRLSNAERIAKVCYSDVCKWELRSSDRRVALHVPNLFFKMKKLQSQHVCSRVNLAVRRCKTLGKTYTAGYILNDNMGESLVKLDEGYRIFRSLRNSPQYWESKKKEVFAMIRQLGIPTIFLSLSANDLHWPELLKALGTLVDKKDYTEDIKNNTLTWETRTRLVQSDPVTCVRHFDHRVNQYLRILKGPYSPIGTMVDFFFRVEFQQRGSPHIHLLGWIDGAPIYNGENEEEVCRFVDSIASCSGDVSETEKRFLEFQVHKHSRTCRKRGFAVCRFGVPFVPMEKTKIIHPYDGEDRKVYIQKFEKIQAALNELTEDINLDEFLKRLNIDKEEYIKAVGTSVKTQKIFLKRKPSEKRINPYMKGQLEIWKSNHDIQFVLDAYACAVYIVDYVSKSAKGMSRLMAEACKEAKKGNKSLRDSVRHIGNKFLNASEVSAQEAAYLILQLSMASKSRQCIFIPTAPQSERTFLLKTKKDLEELPKDSTEIESDNLIKRYSRRHKALENFCLADFASKFVSLTNIQSVSQKQAKEVDILQISDSETENSDKEDGYDDSSDTTSHSTMYHIEKGGMKIKLRKKPRVLRYVNYNEKVDPENFYREQLLLFKPWRNEIEDLLASQESYETCYRKHKSQLLRKKRDYEHNAEMLFDIEKRITEHQTENFDEIVPNIECVEAVDSEKPVEEANEFSFFMPEAHIHKHYDLGTDLGLCNHIPNDSIEMLQGRMPDKEYIILIKKLNMKQREIFTHVMHTIKFKDNETIRLFLTGGAGVGKSVVIRALYQGLHRHFCLRAGQNPEDVRIAVCAPTGLAAYNVQGATLHSAFGIEPNKRLAYKQLSDEKRNTLQVKYRHLAVVIIDEISMVGRQMLKFLYHRLQEIKNNYMEPFGGVHMIMVGDLFQLRPVGDCWIFQDFSREYETLAPNLWKTYFTMYELDEIMRQKENQQFANLLNRLREGKHTHDDMKELEQRTVSKHSKSYKDLQKITHLFATNKEVDTFNEEVYEVTETEKAEIICMDAVKGDSSLEVKDRILKGVRSAKADKTANLVYKLRVAVGLSYETTHNIQQEDGICNGSPCILKKIHYLDQHSNVPSCLWVKFGDSLTGSQTRVTYKRFYTREIEADWTPIWAIKRTFMFSGKAVIRQQFPLKPAAAKTVHKAQGQTKQSVVVEFSSATNAHHHYVAFSRVTNITGLHLVNGVGGKIKVDSHVVSEMQRLRDTAKLQLSYKPMYTFDSKIRIIFQNVQSLPAKFDLICSDSNFAACDVIALAETKLKKVHKNEDLAIRGFHNIIRCDQAVPAGRKVAHGLGVYVKTTHDIMTSDFISDSVFECMHVNLKQRESGMCWSLLVVYSKPGCSLTVFEENIQKVVKFPLLENLVVLGDFNFDISNNQNVSFLHIMSKTFPSTKQIVCSPTTHDNTVLDLCFTSIPRALSEIITFLWSYHHSLGIVIPFQ